MKLKKIGQKAYLKQCCLKTKLRHTTPSCSCFVILQNSNNLKLQTVLIFRNNFFKTPSNKSGVLRT